MDRFYVLGQNAALEKLGGVLGSIAEAAKGTWGSMTPAAQGIAKRLGAGGAVGSAGGAIAGGEGNRSSGALLGALGGAAGGAGLGHALQSGATKRLASRLWEQGTRTAKGNARTPGAAMKQLEKLKPEYAENAANLQRQVLPGIL